MQSGIGDSRRVLRGQRLLWMLAAIGCLLLLCLHVVLPVQFSRLWWAAGGGLALLGLAWVGVCALRGVGVRPPAMDQELHTDALTGLWNRRALDRWATDDAPYAQACERPVSLIMFDLDFFKSVNDGHGHAAGDQVLRELGIRWRSVLRKTDLLARHGGDEFCVVLVGTPLEQAAGVAEKIRAATAQAPVVITTANGPSVRLSVSVSCGVATSERMDMPLAQLLQHADAALYEAKRQGRNRVACSLRLT